MSMQHAKSPGYWAILATALVIIGTAIIFSAYLIPAEQNRQVLISLPGIAINLLGIGLYSRYWARLDEAAQEAHKHAWLYGGFAGIFLLGFAVSFYFGFQAGYSGAGFFSAFYDFITNPYVVGGCILFLAQTIGYCIAWIFWWRSRS